MRLTSNDFVFNTICPNILKYKSRHVEYSNSLVKYNLELSLARDNPELYLNCLIYRCIEEYLKDLDTSLKELEVLYNRYTFGALGGEIPAPLLAKGWLRLIDIYNAMVDVLKKYTGITTNVQFKKSTRSRYSYEVKIDAILLDGVSGDVTLLTIVPKDMPHESVGVISNADTMMSLEYIREAGLMVGRIIEISYSRSFSDKNIKVRTIYPNEHTDKLIKSSMGCSNSPRVNPLMCSICCFNNRCSMVDRISGRR